MKKIISFIVILLFSFQLVVSQETSKPVSQVINAAKLLDDLKILSADEMQGRKVGTEGGAKAREYVLKRFKESGLEQLGDSFLQPFEFSGRGGVKVNGVNLIGFIKGVKNADKYIIITAHYDHEGIVKNEIYNGADDNASGTSALFAMAKYFNKNKPNNSLIFVAFDGEESGLQGAKKFVEQLPGKKEQVLLNINMDMISRNDKNELYASGTYHYPFLKQYLETIAKSKDTKVKLILGHDQPNPPQDDWTFQSDQYPFHLAKIPFIYFGVEDHKDYHKPTDDFVNINQTFYVHAVETILEVIKSLDLNLGK
jgi:Zn-dependent M28 family amino/carboxypeptidase